MHIALTLITGFLGSGKTTFLNQLLQQHSMPHTLIIINEFGDIGIDHLLVEHVKEDLILLAGGCLCCELRGDLFDKLEDLYQQRQQQTLPYFNSIIIETSGLADPAPILHTLMVDKFLQQHYQLNNIIVTADGLYIKPQLQQHAVTTKQLVLADHIVLTKKVSDELKGLLKQHNPVAMIHQTPYDYKAVFTPSPSHKKLLFEVYQHHRHENTHGIDSFCLQQETPLSLRIVEYWLRQVMGLRGHDILRVKGLLHTQHSDKPILIQGVRHSLEKPRCLKKWQGKPRTQLIFITQNLSKQTLIRSLEALSQCKNIAQVCVAAEILLSSR